jgi:hypothetical protein
MRFASGGRIAGVVIACLNEEAPIAGVVREVLAQGVEANNSASGLDDRALAFAFADRRLAFTRAIASGKAQRSENHDYTYQAFPHVRVL